MRIKDKKSFCASLDMEDYLYGLKDGEKNFLSSFLNSVKPEPDTERERREREREKRREREREKREEARESM